MKLDYLLACLLYLACLITGSLYFSGLASILGMAAGFGPLGLVLLILSIILAGFVSGLSLYLPRIGAALAIGFVLPFIASAVYSIIENIPASEPMLWIVPGSLVILIATLTLLFVRHSISRASRPLRVLAVALAALPALTAILFLGSMVVWMTSVKWHLN